jgi:serine/threonine-protein phosphatase with EF-hand domain
MTWSIYTQLEYRDEQQKFQMQKLFLSLQAHYGPEMKKAQTTSETELDVFRNLAAVGQGSQLSKLTDGSDGDVDAFVDPKLVEIEKDTNALVLPWPPTRDDLVRMLEKRDQIEKHGFHAQTALQILQGSISILRESKAVYKISNAISKQMTVVGDIHGQMADLFVIFSKNGIPDNGNPYLFNGDIVDRGPFSVEVALVILSFLCVYPKAVFINRGNHEDQVLNMQYGFIKEVIGKFEDMAFYVLKHFEVLFAAIPLACILNDKIFICHGGISHRMDVTKLQTIERQKYVTLMNPSEEMLPGGQRHEEYQLMCDLLWSDPMKDPGWQPNNRGAGVFFGPDTSAQFCARHNFDFIIRSHECVQNGHQTMHNDKVVTIFSASDYYEVGSNHGAFIKFYYPDMTPIFTRWMVSAQLKPKLDRMQSVRERVGLLEQTALKEMKRVIASHTSELEVAFKAKDKDGKGFINVTEWAAILTSTLSVQLPWLQLKEHIATISSDGKKVNWKSCLEAHEVKFAPRSTKEQQNSTSTSVSDAMYQNRAMLETIFRIIDKDHSGSISKAEFIDSVKTLNQHMGTAISDAEAESMAEVMDVDKDGTINFNEFLESFRLSTS